MALRFIIRTLTKRTAAYGASLIFVQCQENIYKNEENVTKVDLQKFERLSYDSLIKQSTVDAVNSASQTLTVASSAFECTCKEYRLLLSKLINLIEDTLIYEVSDEHRDLIIAVRCDVNNKKKLLMELLGFMDYVQRMVEAVSIVSQSAGMDNLAMSLCERMDNALKYKEQELKSNTKLEKEYSYLQEKCAKVRIDDIDNVPE
ncbi:uncharacterized protein [Chelonus insularis]|uniref:uncharacterized protein isoform X2 n=1 Tax=Chelonus insularis TaxID=460826 RepID=UPI00158BCC16|nr:uncharacterized protein LOC118068494 isoform X2 [Chelonus insularis]